MISLLVSAASLFAVFFTGGDNTAGLLISLLSVLGLFCVSLIQLRDKQQIAHWRLSTIDGVALLLLVWMLISPAYSSIPAFSWETALVIASLSLTYLTTRTLLHNGTEWTLLQRAAMPAAVLLVAIALPEFLIMRIRPFATFEDANALAGFFNALFFPMYLALLASWKQGTPPRQQALKLVAAGTVVIALAFSTSLGAQLCFIGGLGLATLISGVKQAKSWKALALVATVFVPAYLFANQYAGGREAVSRFATIGEQSSFTERVAMAKSALHMYEDGPWYGIGIGAYKILYPSYRSVEDVSTTGDLAHNDYIQLLAEGGPLALGCLLALLTGVSCRLWQIYRRKSVQAGNNVAKAEPDLQTAGYGIGVLCLLLHSVMNFIIYALPLAMLIGFYLARIEHTRATHTSNRASQIVASRLPITLVAGLALLLIVTLGMRSWFISLRNDTCPLRMCGELRTKPEAMLTLANFLAATQPTWVTARQYLAGTLHRDAMLPSTTPAEREKRLVGALSEIVGMQRAVPAYVQPYVDMAALVASEPQLTHWLPPDLPQTVVRLYELASAKAPQNQPIRLALAKALEAEGRHDEAYRLVDEVGMRWWRTAIVKDEDRVAMLRFLLPRAVKLGRCQDGYAMSQSLSIYLPASPLALFVEEKLRGVANGAAGCGISSELPTE